MILKLMCAVALCGSVHRIDGACISCCCDRVVSFFRQVYHRGGADNEHIMYNDNVLLGVGNEPDVVPEVQNNEHQDNEHIIYNDNVLLGVGNEPDVVPEVQNNEHQDNEHIIYNDNVLLGVGNEPDVVSEAQDNEKLDFAKVLKVLNIDNDTASAYMFQIKEMIEENKEKCTYVPDEKIENVINDRNVDNVCTICYENLTNENRIFGLVAMIGCRHLFHARCFWNFYSNYKNAWCPNCRNGK